MDRDFLILYKKFKKQFLNEYKKFNDELDNEIKELKYDKNYFEIQNTYQLIKDKEKEFNVLFNTRELSFNFIKNFFMELKNLLKDYFRTTPDDIINLCSMYENFYEKRIKFKFAKSNEYKILKEHSDIKNYSDLLVGKIKAIEIAETKEEKEKILKQLPFETNLDNYKDEFKKYLEYLKERDKLIDKQLLKEVLNGNKSTKDFEKSINNKIKELEKLILQSNTKFEKEKYEKQIESLKTFKNEINTYTEGNSLKIFQNELIKNLENIEKAFGDKIEKFDKNLISDYQKIILEEKNTSEQLQKFNEIIEKLSELPDINKEQLENAKNEFETLNNIYNHTIEKDKQEKIEKNLEKIKSLKFNQNELNNYLDKNYTPNINKKTNKEEVNNFEELGYNLTKNLLNKKIDTKLDFKKINLKNDLLKKSVKDKILKNKFINPVKNKILENNLSKNLINNFKNLKNNLLENNLNKNLENNLEKININLENKNNSITNKDLEFNKSIADKNLEKSFSNVSGSSLFQPIKIPNKIETSNDIIARDLGILTYIERKKYLDEKNKSEIIKPSDLKNNISEQNIQKNDEEKENPFDNLFDFDKDKKSKKARTKKSKGIFKKIFNKSKSLIGLVDNPLLGKLLIGGKLVYDVGKTAINDMSNENKTDDEKVGDIFDTGLNSISDLTLGTIDFTTGLIKDITGLDVDTHLNEEYKKINFSKEFTSSVDKWKNFFTSGNFFSGKAEQERKEFHLQKKWEEFTKKNGIYGITHNNKILTLTADDKLIFQTDDKFPYGFDIKNKVFFVSGKAIPISKARYIISLLQNKNNRKKAFEIIKSYPNYSQYLKYPTNNLYLDYILTNKEYFNNGLTEKGKNILKNLLTNKKITNDEFNKFKKVYSKFDKKTISSNTLITEKSLNGDNSNTEEKKLNENFSINKNNTNDLSISKNLDNVSKKDSFNNTNDISINKKDTLNTSIDNENFSINKNNTNDLSINKNNNELSINTDEKKLNENTSNVSKNTNEISINKKDSLNNTNELSIAKNLSSNELSISKSNMSKKDSLNNTNDISINKNDILNTLINKNNSNNILKDNSKNLNNVSKKDSLNNTNDISINKNDILNTPITEKNLNNLNTNQKIEKVKGETYSHISDIPKISDKKEQDKNNQINTNFAPIENNITTIVNQNFDELSAIFGML